MTNDTTPDPAEQLRAAVDLNRLVLDRFNARRNLEWKLTLTLWAGVLAAAKLLHDAELDGEVLAFGIGLAAVVVVVAHGLWELLYAGRSARRDTADGKAVSQYIAKAIRLDPAVTLADAINAEKERPAASDGPYSTAVAHMWQVAITAVLVVGASVVILAD